MRDDREDKDREIMERHGSSLLKKLDANFKLIASILATTVIILGAALTIINTFKDDPTPTPQTTDVGPIPDSDVVNPDSDADTPPEPRATPPLITPTKDEEVHNAGQSIDFAWDDSLGEGEQYVLVIYHWSEDCNDPVQCTDLHWIRGDQPKFSLAADQFFLWEEKKGRSLATTWQVLVVNESTSGREPNHLPGSNAILAESERRVIVINP